MPAQWPAATRKPATRLLGALTDVPSLVRQLGADPAIVLADAMNCIRGLGGAQWRPSEALLAHSAPADSAPYRRCFGTGVRFDAEMKALRFPVAFLEQPNAGAEGTTFRKVLDTVRFAVAKEMLEDSRVAIPEIATALGYADYVSFTRAFKRWTGNTPGAWRKRQPG
jgi:hypothetical protein